MISAELAGKARELIASGGLPDAFARKFRGGDGGGETCGLCGQPIHAPEILACVDPHHTHPAGSGSLCFHVACFHAWQSVVSPHHRIWAPRIAFDDEI